MMFILVPMVSLGSPLLIPNKVPIYSVFGFCDVIMTCTLTKIKTSDFLYKSIMKNGFRLKIVPKKKQHFFAKICACMNKMYVNENAKYYLQNLEAIPAEIMQHFMYFTLYIRWSGWQPLPYMSILTIYPLTGQGAMYPIFASQWPQRMPPQI